MTGFGVRRTARARVRAVAALALMAMAAGGCGRAINQTAEARIRAALPAYIGPAREWRVSIENPAERTITGRLRVVRIDGDGVQLQQTITCDALHIELRDVVYDTLRGRLSSVGSTVFTATVGERALNDYVRRSPPPDDEPVRIRGVQVTEGRIRAEGSRWALRREWPFTVLAEPRLVSDTRLVFEPERMSVLGVRVPLPAKVLRYLARHLSDGLDFSTLPFPLRITRFDAHNGAVQVAGSADVMQTLNAKLGEGRR